MLIVLLAGSGIVFAQFNSGTEELYSSGIHAFNSQRYAEAIGWFDQLEAKGSQDPRAFFFRGLSQSRSGNATAANADFETAARMELTIAGRSYSVPKALERIQGRERTTIEQHRRAAKRVWEAEENMRRQEEFLSQKAENKKLYQAIIESGEYVASSAETVATANLVLPFGARPVAPFGVNQVPAQPRVVTSVSQGGLSEDNIYLKDVQQVTVFEEPAPTKPRTSSRPQDPGQTGIFDVFNTDDEAEGFDSSALLQGTGSLPRSPGTGFSLPNIFSNFGSGKDSGISDDFDDFESDGDKGSISSPAGFDDDELGDVLLGEGSLGDDTNAMTLPGGGVTFSENMTIPVAPMVHSDPVKEGGRSIGKGFAGLFKKSWEGTTPEDSPTVNPSNPDSAPDDFDVFNDESGVSDDHDGDDPFDTDPFGESF